MQKKVYLNFIEINGFCYIVINDLMINFLLKETLSLK